MTVRFPGLASTVVHGSDVMLKDRDKECHGGLEDSVIFKLAFATVDRNNMERRKLRRGSNRNPSDTGHRMKNWGEDRWKGGSQIYRVIKKGLEESLCEDKSIN